MSDNFNHPAHYVTIPAKCSKCSSQIECIDVTRHMGFNLGNVIKHLWRWKKNDGLDDLKKARWYLNDLIHELEKENPTRVPSANIQTPDINGHNLQLNSFEKVQSNDR